MRALSATLYSTGSVRAFPTTPLLDDPDTGLAGTLDVLRQRDTLSRRSVLRALGGAAVLASPVGAWAACSVIPAETGGPFPGDGTNGPNALTQSGIVRSDIRASFGTAGTAVAPGTLLTVTLQLVNVNANCAPLAGYAVYLWHCNASGQYSMYSPGVTTQNYLRGVQVSDAEGKVTFTTIFPAAYSGRWPHIHFEIYASVAKAVSGANAVRTSQLALPEPDCRTVYAQTALYPGSTANLNQTSLASDGVFGNDSAILQLAAVSGSVANGYAATLEVGVAGPNTAAAIDMNQYGLTGNWYEPATNGQGVTLEFFPDLVTAGQGLVFGGWFTYDTTAGGAERNRWYTLAGPVITGQGTASLVIGQNVGGNFDAGPVTTGAQVGTATLTFSSCTAGTLTYAFNDGSARTGSIPLVRLMPNVTCSTTAARPTDADFALSGNWYSAATAGQGFVFELNRNSPFLFCTWYTYAPNGQAIGGTASQRWFTAQTTYAPGARTFSLTLYEVTGGVFDGAVIPGPAASVVGTATLTFSGCANATFAYAFSGGSSAGRSGSIALTRVAATPAGCSF